MIQNDWLRSLLIRHVSHEAGVDGHAAQEIVDDMAMLGTGSVWAAEMGAGLVAAWAQHFQPIARQIGRLIDEAAEDGIADLEMMLEVCAIDAP